jgi:2-polyprenyl-6-hydroxyphenyl methylase/3-demethylubiquinone-9 3-methyltransferase
MNIDQTEINQFSKLSGDWWNPQGALKTLHDLNPLRTRYIDEKAGINGKTVMDIGCGGGLLSESMQMLGAQVTGIDMCEEALQAAKAHQQISGQTVKYLFTTAEKVALACPEAFDVVTCMELLEHVPDPASLVQAAARLVKPGGHVFFSTIDRNVQSYLFAILGAEYITKILPKNTHDFARFIRPAELASWARTAGLTLEDLTGMAYNPFTRQCKLRKDISVNYLAHLTKIFL